MTTYTATLQESHFAELRRHLLRDDGCEHAAYLLLRRTRIYSDPWDREAHEKLLSVKVIPVSDEHVVRSTPNLVTWQTATFLAALKSAQGEDLLVAIVHNHPAGCEGFSEQDDENEPELVTMAQNRNGGETPLLSFILTSDSRFNGRIWLNPRYKESIRLIRTLGERFGLHYPGRGSGTDRRAFDRQALAFGKTLNQDLSVLRVAVVGCGGTGSAVAMLLARIGVGNIVLIDNDTVDTTNLNRLHGARQADADAIRPKVEVVARSITELGLGIRVVTREAWVGDPECRNALRGADFIFGCTDDHDGRMFLNRLAVFYLIPVFDLGLSINVSEHQPLQLDALDGRVTLLVPGKPCLNCRGVTNSPRAAEEVLRREKPAEYEHRKAEGYVFGEGNPSPVVVTFTTETACMAVNEFIHRLNGFRGLDGGRVNQVRKYHLLMDTKPGAQSKAGCAICDDTRYWARGDMQPFLDRT